MTERQRFWLEHWQRCQATSGTIKAYALAHELSLPAMYFWRRELIDRGLLEGKQRAVRFKKLVVLPEARSIPFRILLPNGVVVEWANTPKGTLSYSSPSSMLSTLSLLLRRQSE